MTKTQMRALGVLALAFTMVGSVVVAQVPTGELSGRVQDESGAPLPGVTITATSPNLQGTRLVNSDGNGNYLVPLLPPGTYAVTFELQGFATAVQQVKINAGQTQNSDPITMQLSSVEEEIVVTGSLETISKTLTGAATYEKEEVEKLPISTTLNATTQLAPGVHATGPGNNLTISGAMSFENLFLMNGVTMNENVRGQPFDLFIEDAIQETTVSASGVSAEYGRFTGGVVNAITKSGGNQFDGSIRVNLVNDDWVSETELSAERLDDINETLSATLGGFIVKDHLWFFAAGRDVETTQNQTTRAVTNIPFVRSDTETRLEGKLTISPHPSHNFVASYFEIDEAQNNQGSFTFLDLRSLNNRTLPQEMIVGNYSGILSSNFFVEAQYSEREFLFEGSGAKGNDLYEDTLMRRRGTGHRWHAPTFCGAGPPKCPPEERSNENILAKGSYFLSTENAGTHDIAFGFDTFDDIRFSINRQTGTDWTVWASDIVVDANNNIYSVFNGGPSSNAWMGWWAVFNEDIAQPTNFTTNSYYVNDSWQVNEKMSVNIGVRYDENDGQNASGVTTASDSKFSPRLGLSYDVKGDGDLVINAAYGTYVAAIANTQADQTSTGGAIGIFGPTYQGPAINQPGAPANLGPTCSAANPGGCISTQEALRQVFDWYISNGGTFDIATALANPFALPGLWTLSVPGVSSIVDDTVSSPAAEEFTIGVTKRLGNKGLFRADLVLREWEDFYGNRTDLSTGSTPDNTNDLTLVGNYDRGLEREYTGLHTQFRYRFTDRFTLSGNYTWSELEGNIVGETGGSGPVSSGIEQYPEYFQNSWSFPVGKLSADQTHKLRVWGIYDLVDNEHHSLSVSLLQNFFSGQPYGAADTIGTRSWVNNPGYIIPPSGVTYWYTNRDAFNWDDATRTDVSLNYAFQWNAFGRGVEVFIQPEVINLFDESAVVNGNSDVADYNTASSTCAGGCQQFNPFTTTPVEGVHWAKRDDFGQPEDENDYQVPRTYRVSFGFRF